MPELILGCGRVVLLDEEDFFWASTMTWRVWNANVRCSKDNVVRDEYYRGRTFRLRLHREVMARMRPDLVSTMHRAVVLALNGDFLDCRRENLEIVVRSAKRGKPKADARPKGRRRYKIKAEFAGDPHVRQPNVSSLWNPHGKGHPRKYVRRAKPSKPDDQCSGSGGAQTDEPTGGV